MTKLNYLDIEEMANWLKDRLDDDPAGEFDIDKGWQIDAAMAARHIMRSLEAESLALLPTVGYWPRGPFALNDEVEYSACGHGSTCHALRATIAGWFHQPTPAEPERIGYVIRYGLTYQSVNAKNLRPYAAPQEKKS